MEITNKGTGPASEKPGLWIDGNTHSGEVTGSAVYLLTIGHLLSKYGEDELVTDLLDNTAIYIPPRVNPDGAEISLTQPYHRTGGGVPNPDFTDGEGHYEEDVDGVIVYMRMEDLARYIHLPCTLCCFSLTGNMYLGMVVIDEKIRPES